MTQPRGLVLNTAVSIKAPIAKVWDALINPALIKQYMFGTDAVSDWKEGSPITFEGEWEGKKYEDKGMILKLEPERVLEYTHWSSMGGTPDAPENYHTVMIELAEEDGGTRLSLSQDNSATEEEKEHSKKNWDGMLATLKGILEK